MGPGCDGSGRRSNLTHLGPPDVGSDTVTHADTEEQVRWLAAQQLLIRNQRNTTTSVAKYVFAQLAN